MIDPVTLQFLFTLSGPFLVPRRDFYTIPREHPAIIQPSSGDSPHLNDRHLDRAWVTLDITRVSSGY